MDITAVNINTSTIHSLIVDDQNLIRETIQVCLLQETDLELIDYAEKFYNRVKANRAR